ncbi:MAG: hypothetical protein WAN35_00655 [Terracidiphilus sp.]
MSQRAFRFIALFLCDMFLTTVLAPHFLGAEKPKTIPVAEVDRSVIAALAHQGVTKPKVVSHINLTEPFATVSQWTFVAIQDGGHPIDDTGDQGPIILCLVNAVIPDCSQHFDTQVKSEMLWTDTPYHLFDSRIVYAGKNKSSPFLLVEVCGEEGPNGNCVIATALYQYDKRTDHFIRVFQNLSGRNNNQDTRFVESGPLQGDVIVNYPTENAPYSYWIEVYRAEDSGQYRQILRYRARTGYSDGNPLAVADSEMPEILHRLGLWQPGDLLPVPAHLPLGCSHLLMRHGEEWCK